MTRADRHRATAEDMIARGDEWMEDIGEDEHPDHLAAIAQAKYLRAIAHALLAIEAAVALPETDR